MFRASDEVHERKADGDRASELSDQVSVAKAALDQVTRQVERDRARDNRPAVAKGLEDAVRVTKTPPVTSLHWLLVALACVNLRRFELAQLERRNCFVWSTLQSPQLLTSVLW